MTAKAKFVDRFMEHEFLVAGMGVMTGDTTFPKQDTVDIGHPILFANQVLLVTVAGDTECQGAFGPKLITVVLTMGIMAKSTASQVQRTVDNFTRKPTAFACMAFKAEFLTFHLRETNPPRLGRLLVAGEALLIDCCAVLYRAFVNEVLVAVDAGGLFLEIYRIDGF
jgi:hypothetical protein